jgi:hypothetical protein
MFFHETTLCRVGWAGGRASGGQTTAIRIGGRSSQGVDQPASQPPTLPCLHRSGAW